MLRVASQRVFNVARQYPKTSAFSGACILYEGSRVATSPIPEDYKEAPKEYYLRQATSIPLAPLEFGGLFAFAGALTMRCIITKEGKSGVAAFLHGFSRAIVEHVDGLNNDPYPKKERENKNDK